MDLERLGAADLAERFLAAYHRAAGLARDRGLEHHYLAYRAFMRAKVSLLRAAQGDTCRLEQARSLTGLALRHLRAGRVRLTLVGGAPGTGKSTVARGIGSARAATVLGSDLVRKQLAGLAPEADASAPWGSGLYDAATTRRVYDELATRAAGLLAHGVDVVVDASFTRSWQREVLERVAREQVADVVRLRCTLPVELSVARVQHRPLRNRCGSDADATVATLLAADEEPWPSASELDTRRAATDVLDTALDVYDGVPLAD
jgi:predicted kinase